ncbi:MAG TPA: hypothetical protein VG265_12750 [Gaiellaceae bacterium]|nr:hypothetical protein [Gaiellaceae bacterium]
MTRLFIKLTGKRGFVLVAGVVAAALSAKGHGLLHIDGFQDGV